MHDIVKGRSLDAESRRALELDTLSAILPMDRRDRLAQLLTDAAAQGRLPQAEAPGKSPLRQDQARQRPRSRFLGPWTHRSGLGVRCGGGRCQLWRTGGAPPGRE